MAKKLHPSISSLKQGQTLYYIRWFESGYTDPVVDSIQVASDNLILEEGVKSFFIPKKRIIRAMNNSFYGQQYFFYSHKKAKSALFSWIKKWENLKNF